MAQDLDLAQSATLGRQMEVVAEFYVGPDATRGKAAVQGPFELGLQLNTGNRTYTRISINGTAAMSDSGNLHLTQVSHFN